MRRVKWADRQTGDIFLAAVPSVMHDAIWTAEVAMHPNAPFDFHVSHAGIVGFNGYVVEAWMSFTEDSVAAINKDSKYDGLDDYLEVWRPTLFEMDALSGYVHDYGPAKYGLLNLFGFEWEAFVRKLTGRDVSNPVEVSAVCSQGALIYLGKYLTPLIAPQEWWANTAASDDILLRDCDPLELRMMLLAHQS